MNIPVLKTGYKHSPLGLIPNDWEIKKVSEVCDFIVPDRNKPVLSNDGIPWITTPDIIDGSDISFSRSHLFVSIEYAQKSKLKIVPKNSVIMTCVGDFGIVAITRNEIIINQQLHAFIPKTEIIDSTFLLNVLKNQKYYFEKVATKTAVPYLNKNNCNSTPIPIPPLTEQKAIAHILSLMDTSINKNNQLIAKKEQQKKWLMWQLLTGRKRLNGFEKSKWTKLKLGDAFEFLKSYSISRDGLTTENSEGAIYCVHYGDIHALYENEFLNFETQQGIPQIIDNSQKTDKKDYLKDGDIVMADASEDYEGVGEVVEVLNINSKIAVGGLHTIVLRGNHNLVATGFRGYLFSSESVRNTMRKMATGTSVYSVTKTTLTNLVFDIPESTKEQTAIAQVLQAADKEIQLLKDKTIKLKEKKKGLMQQLLTGKKRLTTNIE